jgi:hypothetical protein
MDYLSRRYASPKKHLMKLIEFLEESAVSPSLRDAVRHFAVTGRAAESLSFPPNAPGVKVERTLTKLLEEYPDLPIERVEISGHSGCEFFRGEISVRSAQQALRIRFEWNCKWKATEMGWFDYFGFPDQTRAAREFEHDCFRAWEQVQSEQLAGA